MWFVWLQIFFPIIILVVVLLNNSEDTLCQFSWSIWWTSVIEFVSSDCSNVFTFSIFTRFTIILPKFPLLVFFTVKSVCYIRYFFVKIHSSRFWICKPSWTSLRVPAIEFSLLPFRYNEEISLQCYHFFT